ncbi:LAETG motif-containing sortase-dependent surface protein [Streptomyces sp. ME18-1-4]|uniref:LAETG motif-containing sortase-dependent surface protein n=1 Tax=Streptomyces sp. ME18-1-4 TaxID=3028685 RepID=UPI0029A84C60|nr:LAETG motif-containing sortase-dependent surface protein [Streptomyces sp. ME18-1-4]MDX3246875.1 LAETG motif-containing sortase-dependent surface protein [Streptomyces sp. ME18-1-4]
MSSARRPLLTATAAGTLLGALWFVPSANASQDAPARTETATQVTTQARAASTTTSESSSESSSSQSSSSQSSESSESAAGTTARTTADDGTRLADTGSFDTTPYVVGGTALLALGAGFVVYSVRRERLGF